MEALLRKQPPSRIFLLEAGDRVARVTVGLRAGGLRVDWERLDEGEQRDLVDLTAKLAEGGGFNPDRLGRRQRARMERLIEKGAATPGLFAETREQKTLEAAVAQLATRARRPPRRPRWEERGAVVLPRETVFDWLDRPDPVLWIEHLGLFVFLLAQLENGVALTPGGRIEGDGDDAALVVDLNLGLGARFVDPDGRLRWREAVDHLASNRLLAVERHGPELHVRRGSRALDAAKRRAAR